MTRTVVVEGYTYERYLGYSYTKKRNGRRYRVHHFKTVTVPGYSYTIRLTPKKKRPAPKPAPEARKKRKAPPPSKPKAKRKTKPKAAPKPKPKPKPKAPPPPPPAPPPAPAAFPTPKGWIKAGEWQDFIEQWAAGQGFEITWDGDLYKKSPANDWIARDLFIWPTPKYPRGLTLKKFSKLGTDIFYMARVWVLIEHTEDEEMFVWTRTARLRAAMDFDAAKLEVAKLSDSISADIEDFPYLAFRGLVGWTLYTAGTKATRRRKKEGTE